MRWAFLLDGLTLSKHSYWIPEISKEALTNCFRDAVSQFSHWRCSKCKVFFTYKLKWPSFTVTSLVEHAEQSTHQSRHYYSRRRWRFAPVAFKLQLAQDSCGRQCARVARASVKWHCRISGCTFLRLAHLLPSNCQLQFDSQENWWYKTVYWIIFAQFSKSSLTVGSIVYHLFEWHFFCASTIIYNIRKYSKLFAVAKGRRQRVAIFRSSFCHCQLPSAR